jgi:hypothetical protein
MTYTVYYRINRILNLQTAISVFNDSGLLFLKKQQGESDQ